MQELKELGVGHSYDQVKVEFTNGLKLLGLF